jgi:hypothetical protein
MSALEWVFCTLLILALALVLGWFDVPATVARVAYRLRHRRTS